MQQNKKYAKKHPGDSGNTWATHKLHKVPKNASIIEFYGATDKIIAFILIIQAQFDVKEQVNEALDVIKQTLFDINAHLAIGQKFDWKRRLSQIEALVIATEITKPRKFILKYAKPSSAHINFMRTLIREAERRFYDLPQELHNSQIQKILNRLSTLAFNMALFQDYEKEVIVV